MAHIFIKKDFNPFRSPIDGSIITTHRKLEEHNKRNRVMNPGEYGENEGRSYWDRKKKERENKAFSKPEVDDRRQKLIKAMERHQK
jgi:hypothetical protein|tara:strand:- start:38 stop:295 length:258 start_codon:yes stop_codon:yes gene_type:complete